jgi:tRNA-2-methylthio-N6-dimethylallyladenosine synthase
VSSHPLDFSDELIDCYRPASQGGVSRLARQLHLPVQSGSNRILQKMSRHHKIETYLDQMNRLREICPEIGLSTDLIVGFPTETLQDFQETLDLVEKLEFDAIYAYAYSPRPGTRAEKLPDDVSVAEKNRRLNELLAHHKKIAAKRYATKVGLKLEVLVEGSSKHRPRSEQSEEGVDPKFFPGLTTLSTLWVGRTSCNRIVHFSDSSPRNLKGNFVDIEITASTPLALYGQIVHATGDLL